MGPKSYPPELDMNIQNDLETSQNWSKSFWGQQFLIDSDTIGKFVIAFINFVWGKVSVDVIVIVYIFYNSKGWVKCGSKLVAWFRGDGGKKRRSRALLSDWIKKVCSGLPGNVFLNMSQTVAKDIFISGPGKSLGLIGLCLCSYLYNAN